MTPNGWEVCGVDDYADNGVRLNTKDEYALSPLYAGCVTQLVMTIRASSVTVTCLLTAVPEVANEDARLLPAEATVSYAEQRFAWRSEEGVRQFRFQNIGRGIAGWGIRSLDVYLDRAAAPRNLREDNRYSDALSIGWDHDSRAVRHEFEVCRVDTVLPQYDLLKEWDFTSLTNTSGASRSLDKLNPPAALDDVDGSVIGLQKYDGGHLQVGDTTRGGTLVMPLPAASGRSAVVGMFRYEKDGNFRAVVGYEGPVGETNEIARIHLGTQSATCVFPLDDVATAFVVQSLKADNRIRVEDVKVVTGYVAGSVRTNVVASGRTSRNETTVRNLPSGDLLWRVRSLDSLGGVSAWSPYRAVTLDASNPPTDRPGFTVFIK